MPLSPINLFTRKMVNVDRKCLANGAWSLASPKLSIHVYMICASLGVSPCIVSWFSRYAHVQYVHTGTDSTILSLSW